MIHWTWFHKRGYGWWRCKWFTKHIFLTLEDASDIPEGVSVTEKQPVAKTHALASGFSGEQCPVNEKINTEDAARLSEESRPICHTPSVSGCTSDQGMELE